MKPLFLTIILAVLSVVSVSAQKIDLGKVIIDKEAGTLTKKSTGKTIKLSGTFKIVDSYADIEVKIVDLYPDIEVKLVDLYPGFLEFKKVDLYPDFTVKIVDSYPDIEIKIVDLYPSICRH